MSKPIGRLPDYLGHIVQPVERIQRYVGGISENEFLNNTLIQDAVIRNLEIIGEASKNISRH